MMLKEDFYRKTYDLLAAQGCKSMSSNNVRKSCLYRSAKGGCAVGVHLPDDFPFKEIEGQSFTAMPMEQALKIVKTIFGEDINHKAYTMYAGWLVDVQQIHDIGIPDEATPKEFQTILREQFAPHCGLPPIAPT